MSLSFQIAVYKAVSLLSPTESYLHGQVPLCEGIRAVDKQNGPL